MGLGAITRGTILVNFFIDLFSRENVHIHQGDHVQQITGKTCDFYGQVILTGRATSSFVLAIDEQFEKIIK